MRRILRKIANNDISDLGDTSTLLNPEVVEEIILNQKINCYENQFNITFNVGILFKDVRTQTKALIQI